MQVFFAKIPRAATEQQLIDLFTTYGGAVQRVKLFTQAGLPHHKAPATRHCPCERMTAAVVCSNVSP